MIWRKRHVHKHSCLFHNNSHMSVCTMIELLVSVRAVTCQAGGRTMLGSSRSLCGPMLSPLLRAVWLNGVTVIDGGRATSSLSKERKNVIWGNWKYQESTTTSLNGVVLYKVISCSLHVQLFGQDTGDVRQCSIHLWHRFGVSGHFYRPNNHIKMNSLMIN